MRNRSSLVVRPNAFTLAEMVASLAIMFVLVGGLTSAIIISTRALPRSDDRSKSAAALAGVADTLTDDLASAVSIIDRGPWFIEFTVSDRTGDSAAETIRYEWNGTAGYPATRIFNGTTTTLIETADDFSFSYEVKTVAIESMNVTNVTSAETLLASFSSWSGITPTSTMYSLDSQDWMSQAFSTLNVVPADAISLTFTRATLNMGMDITETPEDYDVQMHKTASDGYTPSATVVGSASTGSAAGLTAAPQPRAHLFADALTDDPFAGFAIVAKGKTSAYAQVQEYSSNSAPSNGVVGMYSTSGGASWQPPSQRDKYDHPFEIRGQWVTQSRTKQTTTHYYLTRVTASMMTSDMQFTNVVTGVQLLNQPEVATP